jgi:hypothetical protein
MPALRHVVFGDCADINCSPLPRAGHSTGRDPGSLRLRRAERWDTKTEFGRAAFAAHSEHIRRARQSESALFAKELKLLDRKSLTLQILLF